MTIGNYPWRLMAVSICLLKVLFQPVKLCFYRIIAIVTGCPISGHIEVCFGIVGDEMNESRIERVEKIRTEILLRHTEAICKVRKIAMALVIPWAHHICHTRGYGLDLIHEAVPDAPLISIQIICTQGELEVEPSRQ